MPVDARPEPEAEKRQAIETAAIAVFSERGYAATTMAHVAEAAGVSRPALYQHFHNKRDLFGWAFTVLFDEAVDAALAALTTPGDRADQLDGFLQRFDGDLWERTAASPHSDELLSVKSRYVAEAILAIMERRREGLDSYLRSSAAGSGRRNVGQLRHDWAEVLSLAPRGLKEDLPTVAAYRRRLRTLAESIAADIERR